MAQIQITVYHEIYFLCWFAEYSEFGQILEGCPLGTPP